MIQVLDFIDKESATYSAVSLKIRNDTHTPMYVSKAVLEYTADSPSSSSSTVTTSNVTIGIKVNSEEEVTIVETVPRGTSGIITINVNRYLDVLDTLTISRTKNSSSVKVNTCSSEGKEKTMYVSGSLGCILTVECASICKGNNGLIVPFGIMEDSEYPPKPRGEAQDRDWYKNDDISDKPIMRWMKLSHPCKTIGDIQDRDWYINTDIWDKPIMWWIKQLYDMDTDFNIFVKHSGSIKKVAKVYVYKGGSFQAVKSAYVLKDNTIKKI